MPSNLVLPVGAGAAILQTRAVLAQRLGIGSRGVVSGFTTDSGRAITLTDTDGERYRVRVLNGGTVRAQPMPGGRVGLIVQGTGPNSELEIIRINSFIPFRQSAHQFSFRQAFQNQMLDVGLIEVATGEIRGVFGFGTTNLSGPLNIGDGTGQTGTVDRIALKSLSPGASIRVDGTLNTLDVLEGVEMGGATGGIFVGRDLNAFNVLGGPLVLRDNASIRIGRDLGLQAQGPDGTGPGGQGLRVAGDLTINPGSVFFINRNLGAQVGLDAGTNQIQLTNGEFSIRGFFNGTSRLGVGGSIFANLDFIGGAVA